MTTAHLLCKRDHALLHWLLLHWLLLHLRRGASKPLPRLRVRPRPQWCRQTMMMPRGRSGGTRTLPSDEGLLSYASTSRR